MGAGYGRGKTAWAPSASAGGRRRAPLLGWAVRRGVLGQEEREVDLAGERNTAQGEFEFANCLNFSRN